MEAYHTKIATAMTAHLQLTCETIDGAAWLSAGLLSMDPVAARAAANAFQEHLIRQRAKNPYEAAFAGDLTLMQELANFCVADPPVLLWRGRGRYQHLFRHLALRFLAQPDSVIACESLHAQWKWIERGRPNLKFKLLNALLKLKNFLLVNNGTFPAAAEIHPLLVEARRDLQRRLSLLREQGLDPRHGSLCNLAYNDRCNLRAEDTHLLPPPRAAERASDKTPASAWGFYCRFLLCKDCFYKFEGLRPDLYLYVAETKSVPNRVPPGPREACGRPLVVAWFEKHAGDDESHHGVRVTPCEARV